MIQWQTTNLMLLLTLLMAGVLIVAAAIQFELTDRATQRDIVTFVTNLIPESSPSPTPAVNGVTTTAIEPPATFPIQDIPADPRNPFAGSESSS